MADEREDKLKNARGKLEQFRKKKQQIPQKLISEQTVTVPASASFEVVEKETENSFVVVKSASGEQVESQNIVKDYAEDVSESSTESLKQLSDQISGLLNQTNQTKDEMEVSSGDKSRVIELEQRNRELAGLFEQEKLEKIRLSIDVEGQAGQIEALKEAHAAEKAELKAKLASSVEQLNDKIVSQSKTISLLVGEKVDLETKTEQIEKQLEQVMKDKAGLELSTEQLGSACVELRNEAELLRINQVNLKAEKSKYEKEISELKENSEERDEATRELQTKLNRVTTENNKAQKELGALKSEHEMTKVHLAQLRGSGAQNLLNEKEQEIAALNNELNLARKSMAETAASRDHLAADREQLAQQYSSYSRDLASQAEKLSEQLRRYQGENARLVQRELALVDHVATLETQLQTFIQGGKNVTEEEVNSLKEKCLVLETDLRLATDERTVLQQMFNEKSGEVEVLQQRLSGKDARVLELETTVERLGQAGGDTADKESLLKACESDKVAASNAMRQNMLLKEQVIELQQALVKLTNDKADLTDQLESASRRNHQAAEAQVARQAELEALEAVVKEREVTIANLKNQVRYLEGLSVNNKIAESMEPTITADLSKNRDLEKELSQAKEEIRSLNSHASELRSQLEVLSSGTREESRCNSTHSNSSENSSSIMADSTMSSLSTESFVEIGNNTQKTSNSSASFVQLEDDVKEDHKDEDILEVGEEAGESEAGEERRASVQHFMEVGGREAWQQLEKRFQHAMEMVAQLSTDKEQLEHLVTQLQDETEIVGDYITIYQHQRKQQRLKMEEKDTQLRQLGKDREELKGKLEQLQTLVKQVVGKQEIKEEVIEQSEAGEVVDVAEKEEERTEKIMVLLSEIGTDSNQILDKCEKFEPWLWNGATGKVITV